MMVALSYRVRLIHIFLQTYFHQEIDNHNNYSTCNYMIYNVHRVCQQINYNHLLLLTLPFPSPIHLWSLGSLDCSSYTMTYAKISQRKYQIVTNDTYSLIKFVIIIALFKHNPFKSLMVLEVKQCLEVGHDIHPPLKRNTIPHILTYKHKLVNILQTYLNKQIWKLSFHSSCIFPCRR